MSLSMPRSLRRGAVAVSLSLAAAMFVPMAARAEATKILFVGNSYTFVNDLPSVYRATASALPFAPLRVESVAIGGHTLAQHAMDAATDGTALADFLRTGTPDVTAWDVVILQDQSEIPGFPDGTPELAASLDGVSALGALAHARGASVVLYLTWGREHGDDHASGDGARAGQGYQRLMSRWRRVAALEQAM